MSVSQHNDEIHQNLVSWEKKELLQKIYKLFYNNIANHLVGSKDSYTVELGSGIGRIKDIIPHCVTTDLFPNAWVDRVENAYQLSFDNDSVTNLILFDIFHHLRYPGTALNEFYRVLVPRGRVIIFEPCISLLGMLIFGLLHKEGLGLVNRIQVFAPKNWSPDDDSYYAAQGNATRIFGSRRYLPYLNGWNVIVKQKMSAISYVASGGYSKPQLYPDNAYPIMKKIDNFCDLLPSLFATRLLVVLEKNG